MHSIREVENAFAAPISCGVYVFVAKESQSNEPTKRAPSFRSRSPI